MRSVGLACTAVLVLCASALGAPSADCNARFDIQSGGALYQGVAVPSSVVINGASIDIAGWCRVDGLHVKTQYGAVVFRGRLRRCGPIRAGRLEGRMWNACNGLSITVRRKGSRRSMYFGGIRHLPPSTFHVIEDRIFSGRGCAVSTCHGTTKEGGLDLRPGTAYQNLVDVVPDNAAARDAAMLRVKGGDVAASFLSAKLHGALAAGEGDRMPLHDDPLPDLEIALVDAWIAAGAPETGAVEGAPELPPLVYTETPPLDPPPGGWQIALDGPVLQPGQEEEGCFWVPSPVASDTPIAKTEIALNPGTHHFAVWVHQGSTPPPTGTWLAGDIACLGSGGNLGASIAGAPHAPYFVAESPPGFATLLPGGTYLGMNAHYYNESTGPIQMKVWVNFHPYAGTPEHVVKPFPLSLDASDGIDVPPFTQHAVRARWTNTGPQTIHVMGLGGHMHKRGVRFSIWTSDGTKVLDDYDWAHPSFAPFDPPRAVPPGDFFDYECLHDNGVTRPVRRDATGAPMTIRFGTSAEDEMCILTGQYYDD